MIARGERDLADGNIAVARQFLLRAAEAGLAHGALLLASTYDAYELARMGVRGVQANPSVARMWYERARARGERSGSAPAETGRVTGAVAGAMVDRTSARAVPLETLSPAVERFFWKAFATAAFRL